jgi:hypothetical protein
MHTIDGVAEAEHRLRHDHSPGAFQSYAVRLALVFVLYLAAGKLGLSVPFTSGNVSPVWPASGVALASVLLWGYEVWPAIALAAFLVNFLSPIPTLSGVGIALGNTSSALVGGYLMRRFKDRLSFERLRDVLGLMALGAAVAPMIAASVGVTTLLLTHVRAWYGFSTAWQVWWLGDAMGVLIITPMFFVTRRELTRSFKTRGIIESFALLFALVATCLAIFGAAPSLSWALPGDRFRPRRYSCTSSRNSLSLPEREGWRNLRRALASIWRMRSRVTANARPTSSSVCSESSSRPKRSFMIFSSRGVRVCSTCPVCSFRFTLMAAASGASTAVS